MAFYALSGRRTSRPGASDRRTHWLDSRSTQTALSIVRAACLALSLAIFASFFLVHPAVAAPSDYPWQDSSKAATGNYLADSYTGLEVGHVFESVTQERLLDLFSSPGNFYLVFGGPARVSSQVALPLINEQALADNIDKIYHFDPLIDGYQADITDPQTPYRVSSTASINQLWTRITSLLPADGPIASYDSRDTLLFLYSRNEDEPGTPGVIRASYILTDAAVVGFDANEQKAGIARVFRGLSGSAPPSLAGEEAPLASPVIPASARTDLQFFNRAYNASATRIEGTAASANRIGGPVTLFDGLTEANFKLHQINFSELLNLYNTPGEHIIFYGATWCHNTQAIIGAVAAQAAKTPGIDTVYVYDTTLGNQLRFGTGAAIDTATGTSSAFNSRNAGGVNFNVGYLYAEAVRPLGDFITENNSYQNNSIAYYPNGDLNSTLTTVNPWAEGDAADKKAIRLQLPFLVAYDNSKDEPVVRQWLHQQANPATDGRDLYLEYMLELAWVRATSLAWADTSVYRNGAASDTGQTKTAIAAEAVASVEVLFSGVSLPLIEVDAPAGTNHTLGDKADMVLSVQRRFELYDSSAGLGFDGNTLPQSACLVEPGGIGSDSIEITIFASYLDALAVGNHTLSVPFIDGFSAFVPISVASAPDNNNANSNGDNTAKAGNTTNRASHYSDNATYAPLGATDTRAAGTDDPGTGEEGVAVETERVVISPVAIDEPATPLAAPAKTQADTDEAQVDAAGDDTLPVQVLVAVVVVLLAAFGVVAVRLGLIHLPGTGVAGRGQ